MVINTRVAGEGKAELSGDAVRGHHVVRVQNAQVLATTLPHCLVPRGACALRLEFWVVGCRKLVLVVYAKCGFYTSGVDRNAVAASSQDIS